jgi:predicted glycosyltransferase involved in capsule biosynthesis
MQKNKFTLVMAYYENGTMLDKHISEWNTYPDVDFKIILVDDGSQKDPAIHHIKNIKYPLELYRIQIDKPWNQNGARNLGMTHSEGWCVLTDMDHLLTKNQFEKLLSLNLNPLCHYVPGRKRAVDNDWYKRHPNSYVLTQELFWKAGGYDEDYCGYYGTDSTLRRALGNCSERIEMEQEFYLTLYGREVIPDASTTNYGRKGSQYHLRNNKDILEYKRLYPEPRKPLNFPWERLI